MNKPHDHIAFVILILIPHDITSSQIHPKQSLPMDIDPLNPLHVVWRPGNQQSLTELSPLPAGSVLDSIHQIATILLPKRALDELQMSSVPMIPHEARD